MKWEKVKFSEIFEFQKKSKCKAGNGLEEGLYPFFTSSDVQKKFLDEFHFDKPGLIFGTGGQASVHFCKSKFAVSTDCFVVHPKDENVVVPNFVYYYLNGNIHILEEGFKGAGLRHISKEYLSNIDLPLPPLPTQLHIASILDHANNLRQLNKQLLKKYDELAQSIFLDMFGDPVKNEKEWAKLSLNDISKKIQIGPFGTQLHVEDYISGGIPLINPMHINGSKICPDDRYTITSQKLLELGNYILKTNDIIMARRGEMGRCAIVTKKEDGWICGTGSLFIRPDLNKAHPEYLLLILTSAGIKKQLEQSSMGTTMANLNSTIIENFRIPVPPIELQRKYSLIIEKLEKQKVQSIIDYDKGEMLFQSLMQRAFNN